MRADRWSRRCALCSVIYRRTRTGSRPEVAGLAMLTGILIGAAAASLIAVGWAASELRWLGAHCRQQVAYWQHQAERARSSAAWLGEQHAVYRQVPRDGPGSGSGSGETGSWCVGH